MEEKIICPNCQASNESEYIYCKNCGTQLKNTEKDQYRYKENFGASPSGYGYTADNIDGVSTRELTCFVGKNSYKIINSFSKMQFLNRKTSWCWPAFLLTWIFGIAGAAFWFIYRRMYKFGAIILAFALVFGAINIIAISDNLTNIVKDFSALTAEIIESKGNVTPEWITEQSNLIAMSQDMVKISFVSQIVNATTFAFSIFAGLFSLGIYKSFAVKKIKSYGRPLSDIELSLAGGTSGGGVVLGALLYYIASFVGGLVMAIALFRVVI